MEEITYLPVSDDTALLYGLVRDRGTIEQVAQLQPLDAYRFPLGAPDYLVDQWQAAMDRLSDLAMEVTER